VSVREGILARFPDAKIAVEIVWVDILPGDDAETAQKASRLFDDPRVSQMHDAALATSGVFVDGLIERPPAWDMYLFFPPRERWESAPPQPVDWLHQLSGGRGAPERFRTGVDLARGLYASTSALGFAPAGPAPDEASYEEAIARLSKLR
jgi:hypothetical protein